MTGRNPIIMADKGYVSSNCPELITGSNSTFNKYRLLVERYFGRMTSVFGIVSRAFPLTYEYFDDYIRTICFLTNVHVYCQKLREKDAEYNSATVFVWRRGGEEKGERHRASVKNSRSRQASVTTQISKESAPGYPGCRASLSPPKTRGPSDGKTRLLPFPVICPCRPGRTHATGHIHL